MKMKVVDQLHLSALSPHTMGKNQEFEVSDDQAADLEKRGLAVRADGKKMEQPKILNKEAAPPSNKKIIGAGERKSDTSKPLKVTHPPE